MWPLAEFQGTFWPDAKGTFQTSWLWSRGWGCPTSSCVLLPSYLKGKFPPPRQGSATKHIPADPVGSSHLCHWLLQKPWQPQGHLGKSTVVWWLSIFPTGLWGWHNFCSREWDSPIGTQEKPLLASWEICWKALLRIWTWASVAPTYLHQEHSSLIVQTVDSMAQGQNFLVQLDVLLSGLL